MSFLKTLQWLSTANQIKSKFLTISYLIQPLPHSLTSSHVYLPSPTICLSAILVLLFLRLTPHNVEECLAIRCSAAIG